MMPLPEADSRTNGPPGRNWRTAIIFIWVFAVFGDQLSWSLSHGVPPADGGYSFVLALLFCVASFFVAALPAYFLLARGREMEIGLCVAFGACFLVALSKPAISFDSMVPLGAHDSGTSAAKLVRLDAVRLRKSASHFYVCAVQLRSAPAVTADDEACTKLEVSKKVYDSLALAGIKVGDSIEVTWGTGWIGEHFIRRIAKHADQG